MATKERKMLEREEFYKQYEDKKDDYRERDYPIYTYNPMSGENLDRLVDMLVRVLEPDEDEDMTDKKVLSNILIDWRDEEDPKLEDFVEKFHTKVFGEPIRCGFGRNWLYLIFDRILVDHFDDDIFWTIKNPFVIGKTQLDVELPNDLIPNDLLENDKLLGLEFSDTPNQLLKNVVTAMNNLQFGPFFHHSLFILYKNIIGYEENIVMDIHHYPIDNKVLSIHHVPEDVAVFIGNKDYPEWKRSIKERMRKRLEEDSDTEIT